MTGNASVGLRVFLDDGLSTGLGNVVANLGLFSVGLKNLQTTIGALSPAMQSWLGILAGSYLDFELFKSGEEAVIDAAADFQSELTNVQIALNLTNEQMGIVGQAITQIADNSIFSTTQVAQAFEMLGERGFNLAQIINDGVGQASINLAEAIGTQTTPAADLLSRTMQVMGASANQAAEYANALTFAFYNGIPDASDLGDALDNVAGEAVQANVPLSELIPTLDYLTSNGLSSAATAGTDLRYMLQSLIDPTTKAQSELANLGIITVGNATPAFQKFEAALQAAGSAAHNTVTPFDGTLGSLQEMYTEAKKLGELHTDQSFLQWATSTGMLTSSIFNANGSFKDFFNILNEIGGALSKLNPEQKAQALAQLFDVKSGAGAALLLDDINKTSGSLNKLKNSLNQFSGSGGAGADALKQTDTYNGAMSRLKTTFQSFEAAIGTPLLGPMKTLLDDLNGMLSITTKSGPQLSNFGAAFLTTGTILSAVGIIAGITAIAFMVLDGTLLPIIAVVVGVAAGIALLSAGIGLLVSHWNQLFGPMSAAGQAFQSVEAVIGDVSNALSFLGSPVSSLKAAFGQLGIALKPIIPVLGGIAALVGGILVGLLGGLFGLIVGLARGLGTILAGAVMIVAGVINVFIGVIRVIWDLLVILFDLLTGHPAAAQKAMQQMFTDIEGIGKGILQILVGLWTVVKGVFQAAFGAILGFVVGFVVGILTFFTNLYEKLVGHSIIPDMVRSIISWIETLPAKGLALIEAFVAKIILGASRLWIMFKQGALDPLENGIKNFFGNALSWGESLMKMLGQGILNGIGSVTGAAGKAAGAIKSFLGIHSPSETGPLSDSDQWMSRFMQMHVVGIMNGLPALKKAANQAANILAPSGLTHPANAALSSASGSGGNITIPVNLDSKQIGQVMIDRVSGQLKMNGMGRTLK
jgi:hypothetical protein